MKYSYYPMGCYEISVWPNGLLWNIRITRWVVMKYLYYPMGCYEKSIWPNELLWNSYPSVWPNELDYLIAAAKWKQVFGSKAHLCRAHLACWFSAASESKHYFALALTDLLGFTVIPADAQTANQILVTHSRKRLWDDNCRGVQVIGSYIF
jgi:hypothetical protein